jgi:hypothetical protein
MSFSKVNKNQKPKKKSKPNSQTKSSVTADMNRKKLPAKSPRVRSFSPKNIKTTSTKLNNPTVESPWSQPPAKPSRMKKVSEHLH